MLQMLRVRAWISRVALRLELLGGERRSLPSNHSVGCSCESFACAACGLSGFSCSSSHRFKGCAPS
eukprot:773684-Rhodomonas_salina.1